ncbi:hypothetical protein ATL17_2764 [Maritalea mobilis]|uniref:Uncharacterized protein n=1 Tax=Maritalea mobilis TaxID=483324 RepID=A0A4R6VF41_9HYPH|nr:hypothetical protein ATL17_2764 [Maritalea mobilis]
MGPPFLLWFLRAAVARGARYPGIPESFIAATGRFAPVPGTPADWCLDFMLCRVPEYPLTSLPDGETKNLFLCHEQQSERPQRKQHDDWGYADLLGLAPAGHQADAKRGDEAGGAAG